MELEFRSIEEKKLGEKWRQYFDQGWPAYKNWFLSQGDARRPSYGRAVRAMRQHLPEFLPTYERMNELAGGSDIAARFLGQYCPPPFFAACSQAIVLGDELVLIRNYDYSPSLCDGLVMNTRWQDQSVIAMTDCMSGVLDGMNSSGLAISLAFGGRRVVAEGFGITLIQRYILENCRDVHQACEALERIPVQISYNIALLDKQGNYASVFVAPDKPTEISRQQVTTNHQPGERWQHYTDVVQSDTRHDFLQQNLSLDSFLMPPVFRYDYQSGYGTVFTSAYYPQRGEAHYHWQGQKWQLSFEHFEEHSTVVQYQHNKPDVVGLSPRYHEARQAATVPNGFISS